MFCVNCGKTIPSDAQFCINCGSSVPEAARQTATLGAGGSSWSSEPMTSTPSYGAPQGQVQAPSIPTYDSGGSGPVGMGLSSAPVGAYSGPPLPSGNDPALLDRLPSWNWAAFLWGWVWCIPHRMYIWILIDLVGSMFIPLVPRIVLGLVANKEAWKQRPVSSLAEYNEIQSKWVKGWLILFFGTILLCGGLIALAVVMDPSSR
ncbi:MAG: hypothetical protein AMXMBFR33_53970 [Candidatus Xenobia bacterium]